MTSKTKEAMAVWERPELTKMDAADAQNGVTHHSDQFFYRRVVGS